MTSSNHFCQTTWFYQDISVHTPPNLYRIYMFHGGVSVHEIAFWPLSSPLLLSRVDGHNGPLRSYIPLLRDVSRWLYRIWPGRSRFLKNLRNVFERFRLKNLKLKAKKCRFGLKHIEYVGRFIDKDGLSMSKEKIETVLNFPLPEEVTFLRGFLGLVNYFRQFVPFHYDIVKPLLSDHLVLSRYLCSNIVANIVSNIYMYVMRHVRT